MRTLDNIVCSMPGATSLGTPLDKGLYARSICLCTYSANALDPAHACVVLYRQRASECDGQLLPEQTASSTACSCWPSLHCWDELVNVDCQACIVSDRMKKFGDVTGDTKLELPLFAGPVQILVFSVQGGNGHLMHLS